VIEGVGMTDLEFGPDVDTYGGAAGERNARTFGVRGYPFTAVKPA
jgi:arsenite methyltransferase